MTGAGRPPLDRNLDSRTFREYYWLKEELAAFCRAHHLPVSGGKQELADRIAVFLDTGEVRPAAAGRTGSRRRPVSAVSGSDIIEEPFVCTESHRAFFKERIGPSFSFIVPFQKWLKSAAGKTYDDAVAAYDEILRAKKKGQTAIGQQFEYNAYIRDFFRDNAGKSLKDAIRCWKHRKSQPGHNRYDPSDLSALEEGTER